MQPLGHHVGVQTFTCTYSLGTIASAGDQVLMGRIAVGSRVLGIVANAAAGTGNVDSVWAFGYTGSLSAFGSLSFAAGVSFLTKGVARDITKSDDATPRYVDLIATVQSVTSASATGKISLTVFLTNDIVGTNFGGGV
jgi:hypothetical protein